MNIIYIYIYVYTGTTPAAARGIASELLKAPDRRRTLASAGLLFFSYLYMYIYIYINIYIVVFCYPHIFFSILFTYYFLSFQTEKGSLAFLFIFFFFLFFSISFLLCKKRKKYYSAHKLVGFAPTPIHTHTHTHPTTTTSPMYPQLYIYYIIFRAGQLLIKNFRDLFFFIAVKYRQEEELSYMRSTKTP
ncbi:unnamed protein product [Aphis gossypii]|uniref:Uncharacterized protein n=1 Tax=Aphis gossypii TaxID=80765 RepID=A0A9P0J5Q5_APHGO|nr:unnamed protein product [Aphis gossypii]